METSKIQKKFSLIYNIVNVIFWVYLFFCVAIAITFPLIAFAGKIGIPQLPAEVIKDFSLHPEHAWLAVFILAVMIVLFVVNTYFLVLLRKVTKNFKNGNIFTEENAQDIRTIFIFFAIMFVVTGIIFSGGILSFVAGIFVWVLYEIFFIAFEYKKENDKLSEENHLTI